MEKNKSLQMIIVALLCCITASAYDFKEYIDGKHCYFNIIDETNNLVEVTYGPNNNYLSLEIPSTLSRWVDDSELGAILKTYTVIGIGENAFVDCSDLFSITIPNTITYIGSGAFNGCN